MITFILKGGSVPLGSFGGDILSFIQHHGVNPVVWHAGLKSWPGLRSLEGHLKQPLVDGHSYLGWTEGTTFRLTSKLT